MPIRCESARFVFVLKFDGATAVFAGDAEEMPTSTLAQSSNASHMRIWQARRRLKTAQLLLCLLFDVGLRPLWKDWQRTKVSFSQHIDDVLDPIFQKPAEKNDALSSRLSTVDTALAGVDLLLSECMLAFPATAEQSDLVTHAGLVTKAAFPLIAAEFGRAVWTRHQVSCSSDECS